MGLMIIHTDKSSLLNGGIDGHCDNKQAIQQLQAGETQAQNVVALQMFKYLSMELDTEGRYLFLNAIANQLRYPNNHTHYFSFIMLYLFFESDQVRWLCLSCR